MERPLLLGRGPCKEADVGEHIRRPASERTGNTSKSMKHFHLKATARTVLYVPCSLDRGGIDECLFTLQMKKLPTWGNHLTLIAAGAPILPEPLQGYLAHKKERLPRTLQ